MDTQDSKDVVYGFFGGTIAICLLIIVAILLLDRSPIPPRGRPAPDVEDVARPLIGNLTITTTAGGTDTVADGVRIVTERVEGASRRQSAATPENRVMTLGRPALISKFGKHADITPEQEAQVRDNCIFGRPQLKPGAAALSKLVCRDGYVLEHNSLDKIPLWVCERVTSDEAQGQMDRSDRFRPDPLLPKTERAELSDYRYSGYDRGHMAPAGNQNQDERLKDETFFLSNMSPQEGALNQKIWRELEQQVREWTIANGAAYVITGGFFYDPDEDDPVKADGIIPYNTIGDNGVAVPTHFYKILCTSDQEQPKAIAFVMENRGYGQPWDLATFTKPIRWIEERAGIDFFPELEPATADSIEVSAGPYQAFFGNN